MGNVHSVYVGDPAEPECECHYVDIGVGWQRVTNEPHCPVHGDPAELGPIEEQS